MKPHVVERLRAEVLDPLKQRFVGRDEVIDLLALAVLSGEHLFLLGPPGTAKSALIRQFAEAVQGRYFEYLLTRFSEPNEVFGPIDIAKLRQGTVATVTAGMLPEAEFVFLDELFNANSAILNNLLSVLNERIYRRGAEVHRLPLLSLFSASNHLPEDATLQALFDRFLLRCHVDSLKREDLPALLNAGWELERNVAPTSSLIANELAQLRDQIYQIDLRPVLEGYQEAVFKVRDLGIGFSDRRAVKVLKLLAGSALLCGRSAASGSDLWVLRYVWDREEQIEPLRSLVNTILKNHEQESARHPQSVVHPTADGEALAKQLAEAESELRDGLSLSAIARLRERITNLADQAAWISDSKVRNYLLERAKAGLVKLK